MSNCTLHTSKSKIPNRSLRFSPPLPVAGHPRVRRVHLGSHIQQLVCLNQQVATLSSENFTVYTHRHSGSTPQIASAHGLSTIATPTPNTATSMLLAGSASSSLSSRTSGSGSSASLPHTNYHIPPSVVAACVLCSCALIAAIFWIYRKRKQRIIRALSSTSGEETASVCYKRALLLTSKQLL